MRTASKKLIEKENESYITGLSRKQAKLSRKLLELDDKKEQVIKKIVTDKTNIENNPKELREYISNSESVLESIDTVFKNLVELQKCYRDIEDYNLFSKKNKEKNPKSSVDELAKKIDNAKNLEKTTFDDNEKNMLIVDSFLEQFSEQETYSYSNINRFENLTTDNLEDNLVLRIFEKRVEFPYTKKEIEDFLKTYPNDYKTVQDVIAKEFIMNIALFNKHTILSRFKEAYYLCRNKEMKTIYDSFIFAKSLMFNKKINPYIITAMKSQKQLEDYIECLDTNKLDEFPHFKIVYEVSPLKI